MQGVQKASCRSLGRGWGWNNRADAFIATFNEQHSSPASNFGSVAAVSHETACPQYLTATPGS